MNGRLVRGSRSSASTEPENTLAIKPARSAIANCIIRLAMRETIANLAASATADCAREFLLP
jgi:hypothetical protein